MLQSLKPVAILFVLIVAIVFHSWYNHPTLEERVQAKCEKRELRYKGYDVYERNVKVCKEVTLIRMRKHLK